MATARTSEPEEFLSIVDFVYSFEDGDYVYFLFKETATEEEREVHYLVITFIYTHGLSKSPAHPGHTLL